VVTIGTAAALHDIGKVHTPRAILNKPDRLTDEEFAVIKRHPVDGAEMIAGICDNEVTAIVRHHHERLDGRGYPDGLGGEFIPVGSRIIAVADTFDAMTSMRAYRRGCGHKRALEVIAAEAGTQLDATVVAAFLSYYSGRRAVAWWALLTATLQRVVAWLGSSSAGFAGAAQDALALGGATVVLAGVGGHTASTEHARGSQALPARQAPAGPMTVAFAGTRAAIVHPHPAARRTRRRLRSSAGSMTRHAQDLGHGRHRSPTAAAAPGSTSAGAPAITATTPATTGQQVDLPAVAAPSVAPAPDPDRAPPIPRAPSQPVSTPAPTPPSTPSSGPTLPVNVPTGSTPAMTTPEVTIPAVTAPAVPIPAIPAVTVPAVTTPTVTVPTVTVPTVTVPTVTTPPIPIIVPPPHREVNRDRGGRDDASGADDGGPR
jgi:hypothetical protein